MYGSTHLHWAVRFGMPETFRSILDQWPTANISITDKYKKSILMEAIVFKRTSIVDEIFKLPEPTLGVLIGTADKYGQYPIHAAARRDETLKVVQMLLAKGEDPERRKAGHTGAPPLELAARACALQTVDFMLTLPQVNVNTTSLHSVTALIGVIVAQCYHSRANARRNRKRPEKPFVSAIFRLLQANIDTNIQTTYGIFRTKKHESKQNALEIALKGGLLDTVKLLYKSGARLGQELRQQMQQEAECNKYIAMNTHIVEWIQAEHSRPMTLKYRCREVIRKQLGSEFRFTVQRLPIPKPLLHFLLLKDLETYIVSTAEKPQEQAACDMNSLKYEYESSVYDSDEHLETL